MERTHSLDDDAFNVGVVANSSLPEAAAGFAPLDVLAEAGISGTADGEAITGLYTGPGGNDDEVFSTTAPQCDTQGILFNVDGRIYSIFDDGGSFIADQNDAVDAPIDNEAFVVDPLCYLRGTRILTQAGEVPVEDLRIGDRVVTRQGGFRTIKWIGRQNLDRHFLAGNPAKLPVRIRPSALGEGIPARDLYVSPGHSMLVDGTLLLAGTLVNGATITHECPEAIPHLDYFLPECDGHDCILAEGAWSDTFADGPGLRDAYHNAAEFWALYPDYRTPDEAVLCAPRPERGAALETALRPLVERAMAGLAPGHLHGSIDRVSGREIDGWAFDASHPNMPVLVELVLGGAVIHTALACDFRSDLHDAGFGLGRCAFFLLLPEEVPAALLHTLHARRASDGALLLMSEACRAKCGLAPALSLAA